jgi:hypothetical protein
VRVARSTSYMAWWTRHTLENQQLHLLFNLKDTLMVMDTRRVEEVERESLDAGQYQERYINTLSQRLCFLLS